MRLLCTAMSSRLMIEGAFSCIRGFDIRGFEIVPAIGMVENEREVKRYGVKG